MKAFRTAALALQPRCAGLLLEHVRVGRLAPRPTNLASAVPRQNHQHSGQRARDSPRQSDHERRQGLLHRRRGREQPCVVRSSPRLSPFPFPFFSKTDRITGIGSSREFIDSPHSPPERIAYPLAVTERLAGLLRASSAVFPVGKRTWGTMDAGFLERI